MIPGRQRHESGFTKAGVGEFFLGLGHFSLAVGFGLACFVIIGLIGFGLILLAVIALVVAAILVRTPNQSRFQSSFGMLIYVVGMVLLLANAGQAISLAEARIRYAIQPFGPEPTDLLWPWLGFAGPGSAAVWALGLRMRAGWLQGRVFLWAVVAALVASAAVAIFTTLGPVLPLDA